MDMQRALRQEVAAVCHALEQAECRRCTKHRRDKKAAEMGRAVVPTAELMFHKCM
jgi:hypothetical protein